MNAQEKVKDVANNVTNAAQNVANKTQNLVNMFIGILHGIE